nr:unnamed protein product [Callosobruchus analis]
MSEKLDEDHPSNTKMSGYLEKKGKKKMIASYKKYWFVLEGRLLLYYRSEDEYKGISPCKGSINLGPPCNVKPCLSSPGRAENIEEQNKWMLCLMAAINPSKPPPKLSHFRYSLDGPQKDTKLQNPNIKVTDGGNASNVIIERLQKIGAQTYVTQLLNRKIEVGKKAMSEESLFKANCDCVVQLSRSSEDVGTGQRSAEHIYERISRESLMSTGSSNDARNAYVSYKDKSCKECYENASERTKHERVSRQSFIRSTLDSNDIEMENDDRRRARRSFRCPEISRDSSAKCQRNEPTPLITENDDYVRNAMFMANESNKAEVATQTEVPEHGIYSVVGKKVDRENNVLPTKTIDHNKNKVMPDVTRDAEGNAYCIADIYELAKNNDVLYEDLEKYARYCEMKNKEVEKNKAKEKCKKKDEEGEYKKEKLKKRPSFIKRVWKRKTKKDKDEHILDSPVSDCGDNTHMSDVTTVRMLSELHDILENKVPTLLSNRTSESNSEGRSSTNSSAIVVDVCENDLDCPALPPKTKKIDCSSPYHDVPTNNKPTALPAKRKKKLEIVKSLDEILDELECDRRDEHGKVRNLIQQFSSKENVIEQDDVVLRRHKKYNYPREDLESDELTRLLEELAKVTNAPILTPGATCSMVASNSKDDELSKLLPERRRRYSEPDYDIPRSHKSLKSFKKTDEPDSVIGSTRFFGPILKPSDIMTSNYPDSSENEPDSMTPDSLEENIHNIDHRCRKSRVKHDIYSHESHQTDERKTKNLNLYNPNEELIIYNDMYANCKPYSSVYYNEHYFRDGRTPCKKSEDISCDDDVFIDSLEVCNAETSTAF